MPPRHVHCTGVITSICRLENSTVNRGMYCIGELHCGTCQCRVVPQISAVIVGLCSKLVINTCTIFSLFSLVLFFYILVYCDWGNLMGHGEARGLISKIC